MTDFPHSYTATSSAVPDGDVLLQSPGLPDLMSAPPKEFGGPGTRWSPETLLAGAVADCFILTFRAAARAAKLPWTSLSCHVTGTLDRVDRVTRFTGFVLCATLDVPAGTDPRAAEQLMSRAEHGCLIRNSLNSSCTFEPVVHVAAADVSEPMAADVQC
jgi:organic hydroperoxide reductase OsmC/OhrA